MVQALNHYFETMTEIVYRHGGIVDKFIGDAVLAYFNAFGDLPNHAHQAVCVALEMQKKMESINNKIIFEIFNQNHFSGFHIGIGINTGTAILGNIGSSKKMEYTIIGETVNIAQRIENETHLFPNSVLISKSLADQVSGLFELESIGERSLKGIQKPQKLYLVKNQLSEAQTSNLLKTGS
jgi:adenylate cyclase